MFRPHLPALRPSRQHVIDHKRKRSVDFRTALRRLPPSFHLGGASRGLVRYSNGTTPTKYTYTGQYSNVSDFGLMFYNARWYDPALGRFAQADSIVPGGVQGLDRYAYVNNSPINYTDPTGHMGSRSGEKCPGKYYGFNNPYASSGGGNGGRDDDGGDIVNGDGNSGGGCVSVVCVDPTLINSLSLTTDFVYPTNQPPPGWIGMYTDKPAVPWLTVILLGVDLIGGITYSSAPSYVSGDYVYATVDYEVHSLEFAGLTETEIAGVTIINNTGMDMNIDQIRTNKYQLRPQDTMTIDAQTAAKISFDYDTRFTGNPLTIILSNGSWYAEILSDLYK